MLTRPLAAALLLAFTTPAMAGSFTYRGQLTDDGAAANGRYDLQIQLYADPDGRQALGAPIAIDAVMVKDGEFAVSLALPETLADTGWLEVSVRQVDEVAFWPLGPKQAVALKAGMCPAAWELGGNAGTLPTANFLGTTDNQALVLRSNNQPVARLQSVDGAEGGITANVLLGGPTNSIRTGVYSATIAGGGRATSPNLVHDLFSTVGGGDANIAGSDNSDLEDGAAATVAGGTINQATGVASTVAGGNRNAARGGASTIGGGANHDADGNGATIGGGLINKAAGNFSVIAGGSSNAAQGLNSTVVGGHSNCAGGDYSFAGGHLAKVPPALQSGSVGACSIGVVYSGTPHHGTFVWADSQNQPFQSSGPDQFVVRSQGGVAINAAPISDAVELSITADADDSDFANLFLRQRTNNAGILFSSGGASSTGANDAGFFIDHFNGAGAQSRRLALNNDGSVLIRSNITAGNTGVSMAAGSGAWSALSDRNVKTAISAVDPGAILDGVLAMPISEWSYIAQGEGIRHLGPMAQDFAAAFGLGENATTISSIDADGVALAAIQGLNSKLERENAALRSELGAIDALREQVATLASELAALRAQLTTR